MEEVDCFDVERDDGAWNCDVVQRRHLQPSVEAAQHTCHPHIKIFVCTRGAWAMSLAMVWMDRKNTTIRTKSPLRHHRTYRPPTRPLDQRRRTNARLRRAARVSAPASDVWIASIGGATIAYCFYISSITRYPGHTLLLIKCRSAV